MKVWASVTAVGFGMAYLAACSSTPTDTGNMYMGAGAAGTPAGGAAAGGASGGSTPTAGTAGTPVVSAGAGGTDTTAGAGGTAPMAGAAGTAPMAGAAGMPVGGAETETPCPTGVAGHCTAGITYPTYAGFELALVEDFPVPVNLNTDPVFTWSDGIPNDSQTNFAEEQITFANGRMILTAISKCAPSLNNVSCYAPRPSYAESYSNMTIPRGRPGTGVTSGEFRTKYNNYRYGRYEVKYTAPATTIGNFLSTMFVFRNPTNIAWNEIDNELEPNQQGKLNVNTVNAPNGATQYPGGDAMSIGVPGLNIAEEHIYAFNWTPDGITWYVDNKPTPVYTHAKTATPPIPNLSAKIMMNLWVFHDNTNFGDPTKNVFPMASSYDYFRFYKQTGETYPCSPTPACLNKANNDYTAAAQNNTKETPYLK